MRYLTMGEVVTLHRAVVAATGGADGIRDLGSLESALAQPRATFDEQEHLMLRLAAGDLGRDELTAWLKGHVVAR